MVDSFIRYLPYSTSDYEKKRHGYHKHNDKKIIFLKY